jgi:hypothetical protein
MPNASNFLACGKTDTPGKGILLDERFESCPLVKAKLF